MDTTTRPKTNWRPTGDSHITDVLVAHFGETRGVEVDTSLWRLAHRTRRSYPWFRYGLESGKITMGEVVWSAVCELVLDPEDRLVDGLPDHDAVTAAWRQAAHEAYHLTTSAGNGSGVQRLVPVGDPSDEANLGIFEDRLVSAVLGDPTPRLVFDALTDRQQEILSARSNGLTFEQCAHLVGLGAESRNSRIRAGSAAFRRAVLLLLDSNPNLVDMFGLVRCPKRALPKHGRHHCRTCKTWGWVFGDGSHL
jgi:hypothetical protein